MQTAKWLDVRGRKPKSGENTGGMAKQREACLRGKRFGLDTPAGVRGNGGVTI